MSGVPFSYFGVERPPMSTKNATLETARNHRCNVSAGANEVKRCLQLLPTSDFAASVRSEYWNTFTPVAIDGHFLASEPENLLMNGDLNGQSFMVGTTGDDGLYPDSAWGKTGFRLTREAVSFGLPPTGFYRQIPHIADIVHYEYLPNPLEANNQTAHLLAFKYITGDNAIREPALRMTKLLTSRRHEAYFYSFDYDSPLSLEIGAPHGIDLLYLFGYPFIGHPEYQYGSEDRAVSRQIMTIWANFVRDGKPKTQQGKEFLPFDNKTMAYFQMTAGNGDAVVNQKFALRAHQIALWGSLVHKLHNVHGINTGNKNRFSILEIGLLCLTGVLCVLLVSLVVGFVVYCFRERAVRRL